MTTTQSPTLGAAELALRGRANAVIPGGMYGHMNVQAFSSAHPQFIVSGDGCRVTDADGRKYLDLMCGWGPVVLGHRHPAVTSAIVDQLGRGDCLDGTSPVAVEFAELLVDTIPAADWAMFVKNGSDATTTCVTLARAATGRAKVLVAHGAYHGSVPWCALRGAGIVAQDQANLVHYEYNDLASAHWAADEAGADLAAIVVCPMRHDIRREQELVDPEFARGLRALADRTGAVLILDDVRCGFRLDLGGSWEPLGVRPDLSAWSKAIANGQALGAVTGTDALRDAARSIFVTGSFWTAAVPLAAGLATLHRAAQGEALPASPPPEPGCAKDWPARPPATVSRSAKPVRCRCRCSPSSATSSSAPSPRGPRQPLCGVSISTLGTTGSCPRRTPTTTSTRSCSAPTTPSPPCHAANAPTR